MICKVCGARLPENGVFCPRCGWKIPQQPEIHPLQQPLGQTQTAPPETPSSGRKNSLLYILLLVGCIVLLAVGSVFLILYMKEQDDGVDTVAEHTYEFVISNCTWEEAQAEARERGGYLATFESMEEYERVVAEIERNGYGNVYFRIGGCRAGNSRQYYWVNAEGRSYGECLNDADAWCSELWQTGEPNFEWESVPERYLEIFYSTEENRWVWNDISNAITYPKQPERCGYIIEFGNG